MSRAEAARTAATDAVIALLVVLLGRWAAGATLGAVLWCGLSLPLLAVGSDRRGMSVAWQTGLILGLALAGCCGLFGLGDAWAWLQTLLLVTTMTLATGFAGRAVGRAWPVVSAVWCAWFVVPCWIGVGWSDTAVGWVTAVQPVLVLNGVWPSLGDWTHQALAYRWLTRLGQDLGYGLGESVAVAVCVYLAIAGATAWVGRGSGRP